MQYYNKIKELREDKDINQEEIAKILNCTQSTVSKYERGENELKIEDLKKLCQYYNVSSDYIIGLPEGLEYPKR